MMWSMMPCSPAITFCSIVGHASFHTAEAIGPSTSDRSYLEALMVSVATGVLPRVYYTMKALPAALDRNRGVCVDRVLITSARPSGGRHLDTGDGSPCMPS